MSSTRPSSPSSSSPSRPGTPVSPVTARPYRFGYAASVTFSRGPESVLSLDNNGPDYFIGSKIDLTGLGDTEDTGQWSSSKLGFHAISTVLNNPHKKQAPPKAHSALPAVVPAELPRVRRKDFDSYLKAVDSEWSKFERRAKQGEEATPRQTYVPPLESVPRLFFSNDFDLTDPDTFRAVSRVTSGDQDGEEIDPTDLSHSLPLLEALSHYSDTVEHHLSAEISARSPAFFSALSNLNSLQSSSQECLDKIKELRAELRKVDENKAKKGLKLVCVEEKKERVKTVMSGVKEVESVVERIGVMREHVAKGEWSEALQVLEEVEHMWAAGDATQAPPSAMKLELPRSKLKKAGTLPPTPESSISEDIKKQRLPLSALSAFSSLPTHLQNLSLEISSTLSDELCETLRTDLESRLLPEASKVSENTIQSRLSPLLFGLMRTRGIKESILKWRSVVLAEIVKKVVGRHLPEIQLDDPSEETKTHLQSLPCLTFLGLLGEMYKSLYSLLELIQGQNRLLAGSISTFKSAKTQPIFLPPSSAPSVATPTSTSLQLPPSPLPPVPQTPSSPTGLVSPTWTGGLTSPRSGAHSPTRERSPMRRATSPLPSPRPSSPRPPSSPILSPQTPHQALSPRLTHDTHSLEKLEIEEELADLLSSTAEAVHGRVGKVLSLRGSSVALLTSTLPASAPNDDVKDGESPSQTPNISEALRNFVHLYSISWSFVLQCEVLCRKMIVGLRGVVGGQATSFLSQMHQSHLSLSARLVEEETWSPATISKETQALTDGFVAMAVGSASELFIVRTELPTSPEDASDKGSATPKAEAMPDGVSGDAKKLTSSKHLHIESTAFFAVPATVLTIELLADYLKVIVNMNGLTSEVVGRCVEFLKAFNSRTCQVVLGAGAMRSAGLKNITAKHLALASQSLSIMISLIPYVRETFRKYLSSKQAVMLVEFDKLKRDYQEHQNEIHSKLIAIMGDRLSMHLKTLNTIDWSQPINPVAVAKGGDGGRINEYMEVLVKETTTLHKVLSRYLSSAIVEYVMTQVLAAINHRLSEEYEKIDLPSQEAKNRLLADARHLQAKLTELKGLGGRASTGMLEIVINDKSIPRPGEPRSATQQTSTPVASSPPAPAKSPPPQRSGTFMGNTNARLKGLLARSSTLASSDKQEKDGSILPTPATTPRPSGEGMPRPSTDAMPIPEGGKPAPLTRATSGGFKRIETTALSPISPAPAPPPAAVSTPNAESGTTSTQLGTLPITFVGNNVNGAPNGESLSAEVSGTEQASIGFETPEPSETVTKTVANGHVPEQVPVLEAESQGVLSVNPGPPPDEDSKNSPEATGRPPLPTENEAQETQIESPVDDGAIDGRS